MAESIAAQGRNFPRILCGIIALAILAVDQTSKAIVARLISEHAVVPVIPGLFNLTHTKNPGIAFSLFADSPAPWKTALLVAISAALLAAVVWLVMKSGPLRWISAVGLALIVGGAASNLLDRVRAGSVVDFVDVYFRTYHWPAFNVADSAIVVGAGFLIAHYVRSQ
ncbi:MAG: signal peptidase II [Terriglobia bacterium]